MTYPLAGTLTVAGVIIAGSTLGAFFTFLQTARRTPDIMRGYWFFVFSIVAVAISGIFVFNNFQLFVVLTLYASLYIGWVMYAHLIDGGSGILTGSFLRSFYFVQ